MICRACGNLTEVVEHRMPFCLDCWKVLPPETQRAHQNGYANLQRVIEMARLRRQSVKAIGGGKR